MIKINLLDSVTERQPGAAVVVERKISNPASRLLLMSLAVLFLMIAVIGWDVISTQMAKTQAEQDLAEQKRVEAELETVSKEMKELEAKIQSIDLRIEAIKKLRDSQAGPSAVLEAMRERITMTPGIYLESIEQTGDQLTVKGSSPDETAVTQFGRSLEFSGGLFTNLNIETQRKEKPNQPASTTPAGVDAPPKQEIVGFSIKCGYKPSRSNTSQSTTAANITPAASQPSPPAPAATNTVQGAIKQQVSNAARQANGETPPQVAKN